MQHGTTLMPRGTTRSHNPVYFQEQVQRRATISIMELKAGRSPTHTAAASPLLLVDTTVAQEGPFAPMQDQHMQHRLQWTSLAVQISHSMLGFMRVELVVVRLRIRVKIFRSSTRLQVVLGQPSTRSKAVVHKPAISTIPQSFLQQRCTPHLNSDSSKHLEAVHVATIGLSMMSRS